jgi:hypothetical protein
MKAIGCFEMITNKLKIVILLCATLVITSCSVFEQNDSDDGLTFLKIFHRGSHDWGTSIKPTFDGGFILTGSIENYDQGNVFLIKLNETGEIEWEKYYDIKGANRVWSVVQTDDGGFVICGNVYDHEGTPAWNLVLYKMNDVGDILWNQYHPGIELWAYSAYVGTSLIQTNDGGFALTCNGINMLKADMSGNIEWLTDISVKGYDAGFEVIQTADHGYAVVGRTYWFGSGNRTVCLLKFDSSGMEEWIRAYGSRGGGHGTSVRQTGDGGYIICGEIEEDETGTINAGVIKTDASGNFEWDEIYPNLESPQANSIKHTLDGGYIVGGNTRIYSDDGGQYIRLFKIGPKGNKIWDKLYDIGIWDNCVEIHALYDGGYVVIGTTYSDDTYTDILVLRTDFQGNY